MSQRLDFTKDEKTEYDSWSKEDIYKAFINADRKYEVAILEIKRLNRFIAGLEHDKSSSSL